MKSVKGLKNNIWMTLIGILVISLALVLFVVVPVLGKIGELRVELDTSEEAIAKAIMEVENYQAAVKEFKRIAGGSDQITQMFPLRDEMIFLVREIEEAVSVAGASSELKLTDKVEEPKPVRTAGSAEEVIPPLVSGLVNIEEVPYKLTLNSSYRDLVDFLLKFEHLPYISEITKISITADTEQSEVTKTLINTGSGTSKLEGVFFIRNSVN